MELLDKRLADLRGRLSAIACVLMLAGAGVWAQGIFENLRMPLDHYPDGQRRSDLTSQEARIQSDGRVLAKGVVIRFYHPDGVVESTIEADDCTIDRTDKTAESEAPVRLTRPGLVVTGVGFGWKADVEQLHIRSNARLEFNREAMEAERASHRAVPVNGGAE